MHPYPSEEERIQLSERANLSLKQTSHWFVNTRKRVWRPLINELRQTKGHATIQDLLDGFEKEIAHQTGWPFKPSIPQRMTQGTVTGNSLIIPLFPGTAAGKRTNGLGRRDNPKAPTEKDKY